MSREEILKTASKAVNGDRDKRYGKPEDNFQRIANYWSAYLEEKIDSNDVAIMMILFKVARLQSNLQSNNGADLDSWVDIAGYAACGGEIGTEHEAD